MGGGRQQLPIRQNHPERQKHPHHPRKRATAQIHLFPAGQAQPPRYRYGRHRQQQRPSRPAQIHQNQRPLHQQRTHRAKKRHHHAHRLRPQTNHRSQIHRPPPLRQPETPIANRFGQRSHRRPAQPRQSPTAQSLCATPARQRSPRIRHRRRPADGLAQQQTAASPKRATTRHAAANRSTARHRTPAKRQPQNQPQTRYRAGCRTRRQRPWHNRHHRHPRKIRSTRHRAGNQTPASSQRLHRAHDPQRRQLYQARRTPRRCPAHQSRFIHLHPRQRIRISRQPRRRCVCVGQGKQRTSPPNRPRRKRRRQN